MDELSQKQLKAAKEKYKQETLNLRDKYRMGLLGEREFISKLSDLLSEFECFCGQVVLVCTFD